MPQTTFFDAILNALAFGSAGAPYTPPATVYIGLSTTVPSQTKGGAPFWNFTEPVGNAYARVAVPNDASHWHALAGQPATGQTQSNVLAATFPLATGAWGIVTYFGIWDAAAAGNLLAFGILVTPQDIANGDTPSFAIDVLQVTMN